MALYVFMCTYKCVSVRVFVCVFADEFYWVFNTFSFII